jgi:hypothetical protein
VLRAGVGWSGLPAASGAAITGNELSYASAKATEAAAPEAPEASAAAPSRRIAGTPTRNCPSRHALRAVCFEFLQCGISPRAGNLLAGTVTLRHAAGLPKAVRDLHANWLLDCRPVKRCGYQQQ